jgi:hypothetical protein
MRFMRSLKVFKCMKIHNARHFRHTFICICIDKRNLLPGNVRDIIVG